MANRFVVRSGRRKSRPPKHIRNEEERLAAYKQLMAGIFRFRPLVLARDTSSWKAKAP